MKALLVATALLAALLLAGCSTDFDSDYYQKARGGIITDPEQEMFNDAWIYGAMETEAALVR